jgi:hypothetical protein
LKGTEKKLPVGSGKYFFWQIVMEQENEPELRDSLGVAASIFHK